MTIATSYEQVTNNSPDGAQVCSGTSEKVAFYGSTPVIQPSSASQGAVTATLVTAMATTAATTSSANGYATNTQADAIPVKINQAVVDIAAVTVLVNQLRAELVTLGIIAGS